jgi:hypothetical protein
MNACDVTDGSDGVIEVFIVRPIFLSLTFNCGNSCVLLLVVCNGDGNDGCGGADDDDDDISFDCTVVSSTNEYSRPQSAKWYNDEVSFSFKVTIVPVAVAVAADDDDDVIAKRAASPNRCFCNRCNKLVAARTVRG